jgi:FMN phosphatase YigB (HAD superfamily)
MNNLATHQIETTRQSENAIETRYRAIVSEDGAPKAVLIDFFDTIIGRQVEPEYVKAIWGKRVAHTISTRLSGEQIHKLRVDIEASLCADNVRLGRDDEFRYLDLCNRMYTSLSEQHSIVGGITAPEFATICESIELQIEREVQFAYPSVKTFLENRVAQHIPVHVVSDSFLAPRHLRALLHHHNLEHLVKDFHLSSDRLLAKRSGRLFPAVLESLGLNAHEVIMLGDSQHSDIMRSAEHGIRSIHVQHGVEHEGRKNSASSPSLRDAILRGSDWQTTTLFPELPICLYQFIRNLHRRAISLGEKDLLFCSREGLILKALFDDYQEHLGLTGKIRTHYYYTSRLSSFLPSLKPLQEESFERLFRQYRRLSLRTFLLSLQFSEASISEIAAALELSARDEVEDFPSSLAFTRLKELPLFRELFETKRREQKQLSLDYLRSFYRNLNLPSSVTLVDVGWKGTIQDNLREIIPSSVHLRGLYLGLVAPGAMHGANQKEGLLFSLIPRPSAYASIFAETCALFEIFLSAQHPGVERYQREDSVITPCFGPVEKSEPLTKQLEQLQEQLVEAFRNLLKLSKHSHLDELADTNRIAAMHARMVFQPTREELRFVAALDHFENFGVFDNTTFSIPKWVSPITTAKSAATFIYAPTAILNSSLWPALSLARHGLTFLSPWYRWRKTRELIR